MRDLVTAIALLGLAGPGPAQQVVLTVDWNVDIAKVTNHVAQ